MADEWLWKSAADLGRAIGDGQAHPVEVTEAYLSAIDAHPDAARIYARTTPDRARAAAMAAAGRAKDGRRKGMLDGVPLSWKDLFDAVGVACEAGSALLKGRMPEADAEALHLATLQGLICLGKTHMTELAFSGLGLNPVTATPPNRNFAGAVPGGSSSGAAASVALGLAPAAIGSDTGGSVRIPAAWNDLVGFKPTWGRVSLNGVVPLCPRFDSVGPIARTVEDCALIFAVLQGSPAADLRGQSLLGARLAVLETVAMDDIRDAPAKGFDDAVQRLSRAGARITRLKAPEVTEAMALAGSLFSPEAYGTWGKLIETAPDKMFAPVLERFRSGAAVKAADYVAGWQRLDRLRADWAARAAEFDTVLLPTSVILPPDAARLLSDPAYFTGENLLALRNTRIANLFGLCAITLRTSQPSCGISLLGPAMQDERLLRLASAAERALA